MSLGQVAPGSQKSLAFWLTNQSAALVEVAEITTSCDCLNVELPERRLIPGQKVEGRLKLDLRKEPQFRERLSIEVEGKDKSGQVVFTLVVKVDVESE